MSATQRIHVDGTWPMFANLDAVMDEDPDLLDELAEQARGTADRLDVTRFIAQDLPYEVISRQLDPDGGELPFRTALWLMFVQGYWGGIVTQEAFRDFGANRAAAESGITESRPALGPADLDPLCDLLAPVHAALAGSVDDQTRALDHLLRLETHCGTLFGIAYTVGFYVPALHPPPVGALPPHLHADPDLVTCAVDRLMEIEYRDPVPSWLASARDRFRAAREAHPATWDELVAGGEGRADLRELWRQGFEQCIYNWGADTFKGWTQAAFDPLLTWNVLFGYPVEAVAYDALAALTTGDPGDIRRALQGAALLVPMWLGTTVGVGDPNGTHPTNRGTNRFAETR